MQDRVNACYWPLAGSWGKAMKKSPVYGWIIDGKSILPVFISEKHLYKGKIYKTIEAAKEARK